MNESYAARVVCGSAGRNSSKIKDIMLGSFLISTHALLSENINRIHFDDPMAIASFRCMRIGTGENILINNISGDGDDLVVGRFPGTRIWCGPHDDFPVAWDPVWELCIELDESIDSEVYIYITGYKVHFEGWVLTAAGLLKSMANELSLTPLEFLRSKSSVSWHTLTRNPINAALAILCLKHTGILFHLESLTRDQLEEVFVWSDKRQNQGMPGGLAIATAAMGQPISGSALIDLKTWSEEDGIK